MLIDDERINALTGSILSAAIEVHRELGPGLLESIYESAPAPSAASEKIRSVPPVTVVPPEYVVAPLNTSVPAPVLLSVHTPAVAPDPPEPV